MPPHPSAARTAPERPLQPLLHDLVAVLRSPTQAWSGIDGQIRPSGAQGVYHGDVRVLSAALLTIGGAEPEGIAYAPHDADHAVFVGLARQLGDPVPDPTVRVERHRRVSAGEVGEVVVVVNGSRRAVSTRVCVDLACDLAPLEAVKTGRAAPAPGLQARGRLAWESDGVRVVVGADASAVVDPDAVGLCWDVVLQPGEGQSLSWSVRAEDARAVVAAPAAASGWHEVQVRADDSRLAPLVRRSLQDLDALRLVTRDAPEESFVAAGAPWFLTLFGRDSLWAARLLLPLGSDLAGSTLRVLAGRQGGTLDVDRAEEPGKILHELRRAEIVVDDGDHGISLPPLYYGTVDATPLWITLLRDAWRWGLPEEQVADLLPHAEAALRWLVDHGDADGDGLLEYVDRSGHGLSNQGWKDSHDSVQWRDGRLAEPPIALCEVQGYAYEAAVAGAELLSAFGRPGAERWQEWAQALSERFRASFWVEDGQGPYPAIALDAAKRPVDTLTSNAGHLLGTGLLDAEETARVVARLSGPDMVSGFGLRTMSDSSAGFSPLSYHGGAVWPHDTAIVLAGMAQAGHVEAAAALVEGLLAAGEGFDHRLPELFSGHARRDVPRPVPYPAACRPQAWAAAAGVAVLAAVLGLRPDAPAGTLAVQPPVPSPVGALEVTGLRFAGEPLAVSLDRAGSVTHVRASGRVITGGGAAVLPGPR